ncbi:NAD-dependent epimerase/dehydratase family protein [Bauldia sp.]|uniref:NAD-dependent epimerase/dehydratase family protein n=1 Tax=Bauldia sp. TaxID=2575872 RepID=UPI003BAAE5B2
MKIFVTGATGVLGRPVVGELIRSGVAVTALARSEANHAEIMKMGASPVSADLFDPTSLAAHLRGCDAILHLATHIPPTADLKRHDAWADNDRIRENGTAALVEAALDIGSVKTVIYPSVCFMYGDGGDRWLSAATAQLEPLPLLWSTLAAEQHVARFADSHADRRGISLRLGSFYGPTSRDSADTIALARKGFAAAFAPTGSYRSLIWIDDAAAAVVAALRQAPSGIFDVVEDEPFTQEQAIEALAEAVGRTKLRRLPGFLSRFALPSDVRQLLARSQRVSAARFKEAAGWEPAVPNQAIGWKSIVEPTELAAAA